MRAGALLLCAVCVLAVLCLRVHGVSNTQHEADVVTPRASQRTLVIQHTDDAHTEYSTFFDMLRARGHSVEHIVAGDAPPGGRLVQYGVARFDNLILFAPQAEDLGDEATADKVQRFVDMGRSVLIVGDVSVNEPVREILAEVMGIDVDDEGTRVQDHAHYCTNGDKHDLVMAERTRWAQNFVGSKSPSSADPVLFRGLGHIAQPSPLVTPILTGSATALSYPLGSNLSEYPAAAGRDVQLVSALQTKSNARVVYAGSIELFSNQLINKNVDAPHAAKSALGSGKSGNEEFVRQLSAWTFHERGLLRASQLKHWKVGAEHDMNPGSYRVQDNIVFELSIDEYDGDSHSWRPFSANDVQLEFTMLDPYLRLPLPAIAPGRYQVAFQVPDVYGVYKFVVNYPRAGYSNLEVASQVSVHPFRHDEFERFLLVASPYYASAFAIMAAFFGFGILFLYHKE